MHPRLFRIVVLSATTVALALGTSAGPAPARPYDNPQPAGTVAAITDGLARQLAAPLAGEVRQSGLLSTAAIGPVNLSELSGTGASPALAAAIQRANRAVLTAKGLPAGATSLLQLRLAHPDMRAALDRGEAPLVAGAPTDDSVTTVTAYDRSGRTVLLDATQVPQRPVFVVDVDTSKALPLGLKVLRETLDAHGLTSAKPAATVQAGYWATQVRSVRLGDDHEPWVKGAAEIFGIAGGFGLDSRVKVDTVTMPYLDHDGTTYFPNQLIVHFSAYRYNLADYVMMEDDGDTNYQALAVALANALLTIVDRGAYIPLVNAILEAIPSSWWTDDPDYVDSWYTLSTQSGGRFNGAAANGWMDLAPYWVEPL